MADSFVEPKTEKSVEIDLFADKSGLVLYWLLKYRHQRDQFSVREISRKTGVSLGLVQRVMESLSKRGFLSIKGLRTAKTFHFKNPKALLESWLDYYELLKKCKVWTYSSGLPRADILKLTKSNKFVGKTALALHSAAEALHFRVTNLSTIELYIIDIDVRDALEKSLSLEPKERGYDVLLIKPYYKAILEFQRKQRHDKSNVIVSPDLLAFLDLYHFPLRGREQAEYLATKIHWLKDLHVKS